MKNTRSKKQIPLYRTIALAHAFSAAAKTGKEAKIIKALQHSIKYDRDMGTELMSRIAFEMYKDVTSLKKINVNDLKVSPQLTKKLRGVFISLANEMEYAIQTVAEGNQDHDPYSSNPRTSLDLVAPPVSELWCIRKQAAQSI